MRQCESCGSQNSTAAKFCSQCAAPLPGQAQWEDDAPPVAHNLRRKEVPQHSNYATRTPQMQPLWAQWFLRKDWIYWMILVVACAAILIWFLRNTNL